MWLQLLMSMESWTTWQIIFTASHLCFPPPHLFLFLSSLFRYLTLQLCFPLSEGVLAWPRAWAAIKMFSAFFPQHPTSFPSFFFFSFLALWNPLWYLYLTSEMTSAYRDRELTVLLSICSKLTFAQVSDFFFFLRYECVGATTDKSTNSPVLPLRWSKEIQNVKLSHMHGNKNRRDSIIYMWIFVDIFFFLHLFH